MEVLVENRQEDLSILGSSVQALVKDVLVSESSFPDEVIVHFVTSEEISELHKVYFNDPTPTDCITFPIDPKRTGEFQLLGEVFVCPKVALEFIENETPSHDVYWECSLYLVHTLLHLLGFNDQEEKECVLMRQKEQEHLTRLEKMQLLLRPSA